MPNGIELSRFSSQCSLVMQNLSCPHVPQGLCCVKKFISNNLLVFNMPWTCLTKCYSKEFFTGTSLLWTCNDVKEQKTFSIFNFFRLVFSRIQTRRPQLYFDPSQNTAGFKIYKIQYWPMFRVLTANWSQEFSHFAQKCNKLGLSWVFLSTWPMK